MKRLKSKSIVDKKEKTDMYENMLPLGSVVSLKEGKVRLMICGRIVTRSGEEKIYDYVGCIYPKGIVGSDTMIFFDRDKIERTYFIGFQDEEELEIQKVLGSIGELEISDGKIVVKKNESNDVQNAETENKQEVQE